MTKDELVEWILRLLAELDGKSIQEIREELQQRGQELPCDSQRLVELVVKLEKELGIKLPDDKETAKALLSVHSLADRILQVIQKSELRTG